MTVHRNIRLLAWFNFCDDFRLYAPVAILYFSSVSGSYALGMSVFSVTMLASALLELPTGIYSDKIGRKRTLVLGACASAASVFCYALGGSYGVLVIGALFEGLARAFFSGNNAALLHDTLKESGQQETFQHHLGRTSSMYQFALAIAAVIGSLIASVSFAAVMWLSVLPQLMGVWISLQVVEPRVHARTPGNICAHLREAFASIWRNPRLRTLSAASILTFAIGESAFNFRAAFINTLWPVWAIGFSRFISNVTAAVSFYFAGGLIRRFGEFRLLMVGIPLSELVNFLMVAFPTVLSPLIMAFNSIFFGVNTVGVGGLMQREFTDEQRATMGSITSFGGSLVFAFFAFLLGALADRVGVIPALLSATLLMLIPMALFWLSLRPRHPETVLVTGGENA